MNSVNEKTKKISRKWIIVGAAALAVVILLVIRLIAGGAGKTVDDYTFATAEKRDISVIVNATSVVEPLNSYSVVSLVRGDVLEAPFEEGDVIKEGDLLYRIDSSDVETTIRQMEENVEAARIGVEQAKIGVENAKRAHGDALNASGDLTVTSNVSGQIVSLNYKAGEMVAAGSIVAEVSDRRNMILKIPFDSSDADNIYAGQAATVTLATTGEKLSGTVTGVSAVENVGLGGVPVRNVTISVANPGTISNAMQAKATVGGYTCNNSGTFESKSSAMVIAKMSGEVETVYESEGAWISSGSPILKIKGSTVDSQVDAAAAGVKNAQLALESAENTYESMKKNLEDARKTLEDYSIRSPISGTVVEKNFKVGDTLDPTTAVGPMAIIYDLSELKTELQIDELDISKIKVGQEADITANALDGTVFKGVVERVGINGFAMNGVTAFPVTLKITEMGDLLPGMNITADIMIETKENVLAIPLSCVSRGNTVIVKDPSSKGNVLDGIPEGCKRVEVVLGSNDDNYVEIISGLSAGDEVMMDVSTSSIFDVMMASAPTGKDE